MNDNYNQKREAELADVDLGYINNTYEAWVSVDHELVQRDLADFTGRRHLCVPVIDAEGELLGYFNQGLADRLVKILNWAATNAPTEYQQLVKVEREG